jgi:hypothetical protein
MYKFYWSNLQKSQSQTGSHAGQSTQPETEVWMRQNAMQQGATCAGNPEPLPARSGRPTTVRVTSPSGDRDALAPHGPASLSAPASQAALQKGERNGGQHHTPTGSHRVLLKLRRGAQAARPKSVHGAEQVMASGDHKTDRLNLSSDDSPSILETLASLRTGEVASKSGKKHGGMPTSKSMHHFYSRTWTEKTLQRYQHNYENVYSNGGDNNNDNPVYENVYFRNGDHGDHLVIGQETILQNSVSAENLSGQFSSSNYGRISSQKQHLSIVANNF